MSDSTPAPDVPYFWQIPQQLGGVDDAYSAWSNAQRRCTDALDAWQMDVAVTAASTNATAPLLLPGGTAGVAPSPISGRLP
jgi:hypothetical protein